MLGYITHFAGNNMLASTFGQTVTNQQRSVSPARARIVGGASYDMDGLQTLPSEQTFVARFRDKNPAINWWSLSYTLGRSGWLAIQTTDTASTSVYNWAKLISLDAETTPDGMANLSALRPYHAYTATWLCSPYWYDTSDTTTTFTAATSATASVGNSTAASNWWTLYITSAITTSLTITISHNSLYTYGTMPYNTDPLTGAMYLAPTSQSITYNASKAAGSVLAIDARNNTVTLNGADAYSNIVLPNTQANFGTLYYGSVTRFTFSQSVTGSIVYRRAYV